MRTIYLKYIAKPNGVESVQLSVNSDEKIRFQLEDVHITVAKDEYVFELEETTEISEMEFIELQNTEIIYEDGAIGFKLAEPLLQKMRSVLEYVKFFYGIPQLDEKFTSQGIPEWSLDRKAWTKVPMKRKTAWRPTGPIYYLPKPLLSQFPALIKEGIRPFFAFHHLHKAFNETNTRHQWINATISAELAFKEFLATYDPKSASLITYAPTPPLPILYKQVLLEQTGVPSPYSKELGEGATMRNNLIHKPNFPSPNKDKTQEYLYMVQSAILHLQYLLYKDKPLFKYFYERSVEELARNTVKKQK